MKEFKMLAMGFLCLFLALIITATTIWAVERFEVSHEDMEKYKRRIDDPRPFYTDTGYYKKILPPDLYRRITYPVEDMERVWAEVVGFKAPNVVGKIAPEIKPGKYTYMDKAKYPFEKLMMKQMYDRFNPPGKGTRHAANFTEIEVVPTRQYYYALPIAEATKKNMGRAQLDNQGYLTMDSHKNIAGYPFPRPEGKFKAQQIIYNWVKKYMFTESYYHLDYGLGFNKDRRIDGEYSGLALGVRAQGRVQFEPLGWFDNRAQQQLENDIYHYSMLSPRDYYGIIVNTTYYLEPNKYDLVLMYIPSLRRIRKLTATDTQDPAAGSDQIYDDGNGFTQKITPLRYPYKYDVIGEGEYLAPVAGDGSCYLSSKDGYTLKNLQFERRPMWVVQMIQLDKNYVYGKRIWYVDKETFLIWDIENYDQKGRLYRVSSQLWGFIPEMGMFNMFNALAADHIDTHCGYYQTRQYPAPWLTRGDISMSGMVKLK